MPTTTRKRLRSPEQERLKRRVETVAVVLVLLVSLFMVWLAVTTR